MPEVAAQWQQIIDAHENPHGKGVRFSDPFAERSDPDEESIPVDTRTRPQKAHDALASALSVAASSGLLPTIGGAAPTLLVSVREEDAQRGKGYAHAQGCDMPLGMAAALHVGCAGVIQRVTSRRRRTHPATRHRRAHLQPAPAPRDRAPRRRLHHPRLRCPGRMV